MDENIKAFLRILKETGLYIEWVKYRKRYCSTQNKKFLDFNMNKTFSSIIASSFVWTDTNKCSLWILLSSLDATPIEILKNKVYLDSLKKIIEDNV